MRIRKIRLERHYLQGIIDTKGVIDSIEKPNRGGFLYILSKRVC